MTQGPLFFDSVEVGLFARTLSDAKTEADVAPDLSGSASDMAESGASFFCSGWEQARSTLDAMRDAIVSATTAAGAEFTEAEHGNVAAVDSLVNGLGQV